MKTRRAQIISTCVLLTCGALLLYGAATGGAAKPARVSDVFNTKEPYSVMAVLPDVPGFIQKLRSGNEMRAFFDSPLGLHFLKSAPLRGAAHLHRLVSYAPESWQWSLYTLLTDGPVLYRSQGQKFILAIALNRKGQLATALVNGANAQKAGDWLIIASGKEELARQMEYLKNPVPADLPLDKVLSQPTTLGVELRFAENAGGKKSLFRNLLAEVFSAQEFSHCQVQLTPGANTLQLNGECTPRSGTLAVATASADENLSIPDYPAYISYRKAGQKAPHLLALNGFSSDYGHMIPQLFFSGPAADQKTIEFLSQAFKTKAHQTETQGNGILIRYPYAYRYEKRKFDLFAPYLTANRDRFFWQSFLPEKKPGEQPLNLSGKNNFYAHVKLHALLRNSLTAIKQFDAIYSPGHFNEFRDALGKSLSSLKSSTLRIYSQPEGKTLRIGGNLAFAEN